MTDSVISVQGLTRRFGNFTAVRDVTFDVPRAAIFGLLGPNGSGKTTIIRMLCGVLRPSGGSGRVDGKDIVTDSEQIKRRIGYMSQAFSLYRDLTVRENLDFYARIYGLDPEQHERRADAVIELTNIGPYLSRQAGKLSGGWRQRLALACALIHEPDVLFLDEPTAGIDPVARRELWDLLFELSNDGVTMLVTTHYMDEAERCTHVGYIYMSQMIALGKPKDLKALPEVTPEGSKRYELTCGDPVRALETARSMDGVRDATMFGDKVHLLVNGAVTPNDIKSKLSPNDSGAAVIEVPPSLEDVFVLLTRARAKENGQ